MGCDHEWHILGAASLSAMCETIAEMTGAREDLIRPIEVESRAGFRIWLRYSDGASGEIDLSDLSGQGVIKAWADRAFFEAVRIGACGAIAWGEDLDLCPDALYLWLTGKAVSEFFGNGKAPVEDG